MSKFPIPKFRLRIDRSLIPKFAERYSFEADDCALNAGKRIQRGEFTRENLNAIFEWKTGGRGRSRILKNSNVEIADALSLALLAKTDRASVAVLSGLNGVKIPVASAILAAVDPTRFAIIDFRALEALSIVGQQYITIDFYLAYLVECRKIARENRVPLRTLDRALWQWSKEKGRDVKSL